MSRPVIHDTTPHGTEARYQHERWLHYRKHVGPPPCEECKAAHADHERARAAAALLPPTTIAQKNKARREDLEFMAATGECAERAAARLGLSTEALRKWCERHDYRLWQRLLDNGGRAPGARERYGRAS